MPDSGVPDAGLSVIAFDGDDTLWHNERVFTLTHDRFRALLEPWSAGETLDEHLFTTQIANLELFGYGVKAFTLSMIETAIQLSDGRVPASVIEQIIDAGKAMLTHPVELLPGVADTLDALAADGRYRLMVITKGDLFDQESKLARSGLGERWWRVSVVATKDALTYRRVLAQHDIDPARFLMVGNSVPSDVAPVVEIGARAVHIPYPITWAHEAADPVVGHERVWNLDHIGELPKLVASLRTAVRT